MTVFSEIKIKGKTKMIITQVIEISKQMKGYINSFDKCCLRTKLFTPFNENQEKVLPLKPGHTCCCFCAVKYM